MLRLLALPRIKKKEKYISQVRYRLAREQGYVSCEKDSGGVSFIHSTHDNGGTLISFSTFFFQDFFCCEDWGWGWSGGPRRNVIHYSWLFLTIFMTIHECIHQTYSWIFGGGDGVGWGAGIWDTIIKTLEYRLEYTVIKVSLPPLKRNMFLSLKPLIDSNIYIFRSFTYT
jgi:hypothetical protein